MPPSDVDLPLIDDAQKANSPQVSIDEQKAIEFYAASVNAWYASALEHDKSIFTIANGAIALLITLLTTVGFEGLFSLILFVTAIISFLITIALLLLVFRKNQVYIQQVLTNGEVENLGILDRAAQIVFGLGVLFACALGVNVAIISVHNKQAEKECTMATDNKPTQNQRTHAFDSVNGAANLQPVTESFQGATNLRPVASAPATVPAAPAPSSTASTQSATASSSTSKSAP